MSYTKQEMTQKVKQAISGLNQFTSREIADKIWPEEAMIDPTGKNINCYTAQVTMVMHQFPDFKRKRGGSLYVRKG